MEYFTYQEYCESFNSNFELMMTEDEYNKNPIPYPQEGNNVDQSHLVQYDWVELPNGEGL